MRVVREFSDRPVSSDSLHRILEAGRATGSSQNRQAWKFYVVRGRARLDELSATVFAPDNLRGCPLAIALASAGRGGFDIGRCAQDMILAAWNEGIGSVPNGVRDADTASALLGTSPDESLATILSFGYPAHPWTPREGDVQGILQRIKRKPLEELVVWVD